MKKDVIYIDSEDDITSIIGKVKAAQQKIVALVPPKTIGVLQSAINLRLLEHSAAQDGKRLVVITNNSALTALAAAVSIPVARNLQSKPEVPAIPVLDMDEGDVIDGSSLPVGDLARIANPDGGLEFDEETGEAKAADSPHKEAAHESRFAVGAVAAMPGAMKATEVLTTATKRVNIPNFSLFRRRLFLGLAGLVLLVGFLVWAVAFAPQAIVNVQAIASPRTLDAQVALSLDQPTSLNDGRIRAERREDVTSESLTFTATGQKDIGDKASGQVVFENCETMTPQEVAAGTVVMAAGKNYVVQTAVSVPGGVGGFLGCSAPGVSDAVSIAADGIGEEYNTPKATRFSVAGHEGSTSSVYFNAVSSTAITGGTRQTVKVVSQSDIDQAEEQLRGLDFSKQKTELSGRFNDSYDVIVESFASDFKDVAATPAVDQEAQDGKATLKAKVIHSMVAVKSNELSTYLTAFFTKQLEGKKDQQIYDNGLKGAKFGGFNRTAIATTAELAATAKVGPKIEEFTVKQRAAGKRFGEIQASLQTIDGVKDVRVDFWPFWVRKVPANYDKISVKFDFKNE